MREDRPRASGVILAAGKGERFGASRNKAFVELLRKPLLLWSAEAFAASGAVGEIVAVARAGEETQVEEVLQGIAIPWKVVPGGARRQDSSLAGVRVAGGEYVLIHDAARPLVSAALIREVLQAAEAHGAAVPVVPVRDTLRYVEGDFVSGREVAREGLHHVQTPQGFRRELILTALEEAQRQGHRLADDATAVILVGGKVAAVPGDPRNLKITYPEDLALARALLGGA